jgi:hypothetical protein
MGDAGSRHYSRGREPPQGNSFNAGIRLAASGQRPGPCWAGGLLLESVDLFQVSQVFHGPARPTIDSYGIARVIAHEPT